MGFHGGGETTLEDEIIYDPDIMPLIDQAEKGIRDSRTWEPVGVAPDGVRMLLETFAYRLVKQERGL